MNKEKIQTAILEMQDDLDIPENMKSILSFIIEKVPGRKDLERMLEEKGLNFSVAKVHFLHFVLEYIKFTLKDDLISEEEKSNIMHLKRLFQIRPGDFYLHHNLEVEQVITDQFLKMYKDNLVTNDEALLKVHLQEIFDLSFDQMNEYSKNESITSMKQGVDVKDLDVFFSYEEYSKLKAEGNNKS